MKLQSFLVTLLAVCLSTSAVYAQSADAVAKRNEGYRLQQDGKVKEAIDAYEKAINIDPSYAVPHNDLGILYEEAGKADKAEKAYLAALKADGNYSGVYSNLASLYETQGDLDNALFYWERRSTMGDPGDVWRKKAAGKADQIKKQLGRTAKPAPAQAAPFAAPAPRTAQKSRPVTVSKPSVAKSIAKAKRDIRKHRYQEAINSLEQTKKYVRDDHRIDETIYEAREKAIEYDVMRASQDSTLYKKRKLIDVANAWYPPTPEPDAGKITKDTSALTAKSPARLILEKKANQIIPSIDFTDAQLKDVVEYLALSNDINIVIDESVVTDVSGVTVHLKNIPLIEALDIILRTKGLKYRFEDNIIWITTAEKLAEEDLEVRVYDVQDLVGKIHDFPSVPFSITDAVKEIGSEDE